MDDLVWTLVLSALPALAILIFIVWWTLPRSPHKKRSKDTIERR